MLNLKKPKAGAGKIPSSSQKCSPQEICTLLQNPIPIWSFCKLLILKNPIVVENLKLLVLTDPHGIKRGSVKF